MGISHPGRLELGSEGDEEEHGGALHPVDQEIEQLERGRICPVHVLVQGQHRPAPCEAQHLIDQLLQRPLLLPMRAYVERRVARICLERQQGREQRGDRGDIIGRGLITELVEQRLRLL
jgi:hypothetical protein